MKSKKQRANHRSYITKTLRKVIMKPSELASKYHKKKNNQILQQLRETKKVLT